MTASGRAYRWFTVRLRVFIVLFVICYAMSGDLSMICVSAEENSRIVLSDANVSFELPEGWTGVSRSSMDQESLDRMSLSYNSMAEDFSKNSGSYYAMSLNRQKDLYVSSSEDERSKKIFSTAEGQYSLITEYLSSPSRYRYMRNHGKIKISNCTDKITADGAVFYIVEYSSDNGYGICYSGVVNGKYISLDFMSKSGSVTDADKRRAANLMRSLRILKTEELKKLDRSQIFIIGGAVFLALVLLIAIIVNVRKKQSY